MEVDGKYYHLSHPGTRPTSKKEVKISTTIPTKVNLKIASVFGTDIELLGAIVEKKGLFEFDKSRLCFRQVRTHISVAHITLSHVAVLASEEAHVAAVTDLTTSKPTKPEPCVLRFRHHSELFRWYREGHERVAPPTRALLLPAPATELRAGACAFAARLREGHVVTWGAPIHGHLLGRHVDVERPADEPHRLDLPLDLVGAVVRVALCGNLGAVVTSSGGAYVWGEVLSPPLAGDFTLSQLFGDEAQLLRLVDIEHGGEQLDVVDMDVGVSHLVCLTEGGLVWVAGTNENGQLGLPTSPPKTEWTRRGDLVAKRVVCGPKSSFFICDDV